MKVVLGLIIFVQIGGILGQTDKNLENLEKVCYKNGGNAAVVEMQRAVVTAQQCVQPIITDWILEIQRTGKMESGLKQLCREISTAKNCLKGFMNTVKICFKKDQHETVDLSYRLAASGLQFVCDNMEDIKKALTSWDKDCPATKQNALQKCAERFNTSTSHHQAEVDPVEALSKIKVTYDAKGCSDLLSFEQCTIKPLEECRDKTFSHLLDTMYQYINNEIPCDNLPKSKASTISVVTVLLFATTIITMHL